MADATPYNGEFRPFSGASAAKETPKKPDNKENLKGSYDPSHDFSKTSNDWSGTAREFAAGASPSSLMSADQTQNMDRYANSRDEASATPVGMADKYNVTGVTGRRSSNLSRLVDALNNKSWVATTANLGFGPQGQEKGGGNVKELSMPTVETAESRQQQRMENYQSTAATNELDMRSWLRRMAPQLEQQRNQFLLQFKDKLDSTQISAFNQALSLAYAEALKVFTDEQMVQQALKVTKLIRTLPDEAQGAFFANFFNNQYMPRWAAQMSSRMGDILQNAAATGNLTQAQLGDLQWLSKMLGVPSQLAFSGAMTNAMDAAGNVINYVK